uniref:Uncharacterized protein n=1 Tax=Octopus bimaculoides TaxID=37653 RepID=A0A0L8I1H4_OCTBM
MEGEQNEEHLQQDRRRQQIRRENMNEEQHVQYQKQQRHLSQQKRENMNEEQHVQVKLAAPPGREPYCFRIPGQTNHTTMTNLHPANDQLQYGQLYIIDADEALQHRMDAPQNSECSSVTMRKISTVNFQDLHTVGEILPKFKASCLRYSLLANDDTLSDALTVACYVCCLSDALTVACYVCCLSDALTVAYALTVACYVCCLSDALTVACYVCCPVHVYEPCKCSSPVDHSQEIHD